MLKYIYHRLWRFSSAKVTCGSIDRRDINGALLADRLLYNVWAGGAPTPVGPNFVVRARLVQWDTENSVRGARGNILCAMTSAKASIA